MASEMEVFISAQDSIYVPGGGGNKQRRLRVVFSIPEMGINAKTGILCLIPGYGDCIDSRVYHKMRTQFADEYNMAVLQCDYFGIQYMQNFEEKLEQIVDGQMLSGKDEIQADIDTGESWLDCNDMGVMQEMVKRNSFSTH